MILNLQAFPQRSGLLSTYTNIYWIVGGKFKKGDKFILEKKYYKNIKSLYYWPQQKSHFINQFKNKIHFKYLKNLKKAILAIKKDIKKDKKKKIVLFSPAAASFDQFRDFQHRGNYFNLLIKKIGLYA